MAQWLYTNVSQKMLKEKHSLEFLFVYSLYSLHMARKKPQSILRQRKRLLILYYSTLRYSTLARYCRYSTLLYTTLLYSTLLYATVLYAILLYATLCYSTLHYENFTCRRSCRGRRGAEKRYAFDRTYFVPGING